MRTIAFSLVLAGLVIVPLAAHANPTCTTEPKAKWMSEETIKAKITALGYQKIRSFKVTESCYEIYGPTRTANWSRYISTRSPATSCRL